MVSYARNIDSRFDALGDEIYLENIGLFGMFAKTGLLMSIAMLASRVPAMETGVIVINVVFCLYFVVLFLARKKIIDKINRQRSVELMYVVTSIAFIMSGLMGIRVGSDVQAISFMLLVVTFPVFIFDKPVRILGFVTAASAVFMVFDYLNKFSMIFFYDAIDLFISYVASVALIVLICKTRLESCEHRKMMAETAEHNPVTGLKNRYAMRQTVEKYYGREAVVMMIDLDDFKFFNDMYGHDTGDAVLREFSGAMQSVFKGCDCYGYGGDEFLVVMPDRTLEEGRGKLVELREAAENLEFNGLTMHPLFSCGMVHGMIEDDSAFYDMVSTADLMMFRSKRRGKGNSESSEFTGAISDKDALTDEKTSGGDSRSLVDPLTDLLNVVYFRKSLEDMVNNIIDFDRKPEVVYLNVRNFKSYNDVKGFAKGDDLLVFIARQLKDLFPNSQISRISEDRFVMVIYADENDRLQELQDRMHRYTGSNVVQIKAGIYVCEKGVDSEEAYDCAKDACDSIRKDPNVNIKFYDDEIRRSVHNEQYVLTGITRAIKEGQITAYYQPIINMKTGAVESYEALSRWIDPEHGMIMPGDYIPVLEKHQLIGMLDKYMVELVCRDIEECRRRGIPVKPVSINLSAHDIEHGDTVGDTKEIMEAHGVERDEIIYEVTEGAIASVRTLYETQIKRMHEAGIRVWLDDFGSGFSSLDMLNMLDFDGVKLSSRFINRIGQDGTAEVIIEEMLVVAKKFGLKTIVEGVETQDQLAFLSKAGGEYVQGFIFGRPVPFEEAVSTEVIA
jgi:diguanylate cyclase (GGDEF)-like protein